MIDYLIPIAIANLISEQSIIRNLINKWFEPRNYLNYTGSKRFVYDLLSCWTCLSVWTTLIFLLIKQEPIWIHYLYQPLTNMLIVDIIQKIKR
jgi:hypothetical protein